MNISFVTVKSDLSHTHTHTHTHTYMLCISNSFAVSGVVTELSCSSELCVPQIVQYHCETSTMNLLWQKGPDVTLGGLAIGITFPSLDGYSITITIKDGGFSSNISFMADGNNETTVQCVDLSVGFDDTHNCLLTIGEFYLISTSKYCINTK